MVTPPNSNQSTLLVLKFNPPKKHSLMALLGCVSRYARLNDVLQRDGDGTITLPSDATWIIPVTIDTEINLQN